MSDAEERILRSISEAGALFADQISPDRDTTDRLQALLKSGLVEYCYIGDDRSRMGYRVTLKGRDLLSSAEQERQDRAEQAAQQDQEKLRSKAEKIKDYRHDFAVAAFSVALALLVEHFGEIIEFFKALANR